MRRYTMNKLAAKQLSHAHGQPHDALLWPSGKPAMLAPPHPPFHMASTAFAPCRWLHSRPAAATHLSELQSL
jgi:hypothetical protein